MLRYIKKMDQLETLVQHNAKKTVTRRQMSAISRGIERGKEIRDSLAAIADDYRAGMTLSEIVSKYNIMNKFEIDNEDVAGKAVKYALSGYDGTSISLHNEHYEGLMTQEEYSKISARHQVDSRIRVGKRLYEEGNGLFSIPREKKRQMGIRHGKNQYSQKKGIHALDIEQKRENGRKGAAARGYVAWDHYETVVAYALSILPEYQRSGNANNTKVAEALNAIFHNEEPVRNSRRVSAHLCDYRMQIQKSSA